MQERPVIAAAQQVLIAAFEALIALLELLYSTPLEPAQEWP